jgi:predicted MPP superfamily phosphohydrolase
MKFATLRLAILTPAILAQFYLFARARKAVRSSRRSDRFKSSAVRLIGLAIALMFLLNWYILTRPIPWVEPPRAAQFGLFFPPAAWSLGSMFSALLLFLTQISGSLGRVGVRLYRRAFSATALPQAAANPESQGRRLFLKAGVGGIAAAPFVLSGYGAAYASRACDVRQLNLSFGRSLRVVQLSDIHAGIYMTPEQIRHYADQAIALQPDLLVLTGDFISNSILFLPGCLKEMIRVNARYGTFAILGNHEHWYGRLSEIRTIFRKYRIPLLVNAHHMIQTERGAFAIAGIDDLRSGHPDLEKALAGLHPHFPTLLLSHRPEIFPRAAARGIPLTLAGHYHGGQVKLRLPGGDISIATLMTPYPEGLYRIDTSYLYVSRGVGTTFTPVRLNAPPEITLFHLT